MEKTHTDYYILKIYFDRTIIKETKLISEYKKKIKEIQSKFEVFKDIESGETFELDAGFDLFIPNIYNVDPKTFGYKINYGINCAMTFNGKHTAYYLYPRSSMGSRTPLRLSNSLGIIDSGYRGHIIGVVDNLSENCYGVNIYDRLMQICGPNIMYPIYPIIVDTIEELGITSRGTNGFGSTGR